MAVLPLLKVMVPFPTLFAKRMEEPAVTEMEEPAVMVVVVPFGKVRIPVALHEILSVPGVPLGNITVVSVGTISVLLTVLSCRARLVVEVCRLTISAPGRMLAKERSPTASGLVFTKRLSMVS